MKDALRLIHKGEEIIHSCGIETGTIVKVTTGKRMTRTLGYCRTIWNPDGKKAYEIRLSEWILQDNVKEDDAMGVVIHEILHTCSGCHGHDINWKRYGCRVMAEYPQYVIHTYANKDYAKFGLPEAPERKRR